MHFKIKHFYKLNVEIISMISNALTLSTSMKCNVKYNQTKYGKSRNVNGLLILFRKWDKHAKLRNRYILVILTNVWTLESCICYIIGHKWFSENWWPCKSAFYFWPEVFSLHGSFILPSWLAVIWDIIMVSYAALLQDKCLLYAGMVNLINK